MNKAISMSLLAVVLLWAVPVRADFNENASASGKAKAEEAAAEMRSLVESDRSLSFIKEVSVEKDFLGRPRLKLLAERPETKAKRDKFELAVDWQFSCDPSWHCDSDGRPMLHFKIGYKIVYDTPGKEDAEEAAAEMRALVKNASEPFLKCFGNLKIVKEVSVEKDFWGQPRLRLSAIQPETKLEREKFELAVSWLFSGKSEWWGEPGDDDYPNEPVMMRFGIGYRIAYED